jgi:hypothetical protein
MMVDLFAERMERTAGTRATMLREMIRSDALIPFSVSPVPASPTIPTVTGKIVIAPIPALLSVRLILRHFVPVNRRTLFRWLSSGEFPKADVSKGRKVRLWKRETVEEWISGNAEN